jgi:hypothetical protein
MLNTEIMQESPDFGFIINTFGYLNHLRKVLDQTTIRSFRCFTRTDPSPLGRVKVTSFEVWL